jgi:hypothetical protein
MTASGFAIKHPKRAITVGCVSLIELPDAITAGVIA